MWNLHQAQLIGDNQFINLGTKSYMEVGRIMMCPSHIKKPSFWSRLNEVRVKERRLIVPIAKAPWDLAFCQTGGTFQINGWKFFLKNEMLPKITRMVVIRILNWTIMFLKRKLFITVGTWNDFPYNSIVNPFWFFRLFVCLFLSGGE